MNDELTIECDWLGSQANNALERAFYANIGLAVSDIWLTQLDDQEASTVTNHLRACAHRLAVWFAANWWRLRWEPETSTSAKDVDWRIAHGLASAGGGYVWPNIIFASDGESLAIASRNPQKNAPFEPIRYLNQINARITAAEFERKVDAFMGKVITRAHALNIHDHGLHELWNEILEERQDPKATRWRKLEALCGYDPDEAPEALIKHLLDDPAKLGGFALEELAAHGRHNTQDLLKPILKLAKSNTKPTGGGFRGKIPQLKSQPQSNPADRPWQQAAKLAQQARKEWDLGTKPIPNKVLGELLGTKPAFFADRTKSATPMPIMLKSENGNDMDFYVDSPWDTTRRFATSRLLGDYLAQTTHERLIPATKAKTARQQFQRSFAQEFLCPFDALLEKIQTDDPEEEDIAEAAKYFCVSPLMVRTTLVNKGEMDRETLNWDI